MRLTKEQALDILYGEVGEIIEDEVVDHSRWSIHHDLVVKLDGKFYSAIYSVGATEYQDETPWQYKGSVEFIEVEPKEKITTIYVRKQ